MLQNAAETQVSSRSVECRMMNIGPITPDDCDAKGFMLDAAYLARVSDGMPHFFRSLLRGDGSFLSLRRDGERPSNIGGAALEYRFAYHGRPRLGDMSRAQD